MAPLVGRVGSVRCIHLGAGLKPVPERLRGLAGLCHLNTFLKGHRSGEPGRISSQAADEPRSGDGTLTNTDRLILPVAASRGTEAIDHGNTLAVCLASPEEREIVLMIPHGVARTSVDEIGASLDQAAQARERWSGSRIGPPPEWTAQVGPQGA